MAPIERRPPLAIAGGGHSRAREAPPEILHPIGQSLLPLIELGRVAQRTLRLRHIGDLGAMKGTERPRPEKVREEMRRFWVVKLVCEDCCSAVQELGEADHGAGELGIGEDSSRCVAWSFGCDIGIRPQDWRSSAFDDISDDRLVSGGVRLPLDVEEVREQPSLVAVAP